jgi:hypothetical protein
MIKPHALVGLKSVALVIPKRPNGSFRVQLPQSFSPALNRLPDESLSAFGLDQGVAVEGSRFVYVRKRLMNPSG